MTAAGARYTVGVDFGTASARAVVVDVADGRELGVAVHVYANGVIDERLPGPDRDVVLGPDWALQDPTTTSRHSGTPSRRARQRRHRPGERDRHRHRLHACTMLPTTADGTPLCQIPDYRHDPHAWVKLWKHHAAQPEADKINRVAAELGEPWLDRYGGRISSEWFFPKALQILREAPEIYEAADRLIEAADWVVWQLTGRRDAQQLHGRVQGHVGGRGRLPGPAVLRRAGSPLRRCRRRQAARDIVAARRPARAG